MAKAAVIGDPISHSLSPAIYTFLAAQNDVEFSLKPECCPFTYSAVNVVGDSLNGFLEGVTEDADWIGFNVTIPHKEKLLSKLDTISNEAKVIGAVNVVKINDHELAGFNTDATSIERILKGRTKQQAKAALVPGTALLLGAGGAARAAAYALGKLKFKKVYIANRTADRAENLARTMSVVFPDTVFNACRFLNSKSPEECPEVMQDSIDLVVQSTSLGLGKSDQDQPDWTYLKKIKFSKDAFAFDMIYRPESTEFLKSANNLGLQVIGGLEMLIEQACDTWKIFFDQTVTDDVKTALAIHLRSKYLEDRPIFLTGMPASGKSTTGKALANDLGWDLIDTDAEIEKQMGATVASVFENMGETYFRKLEKEIVTTAAGLKRTVVSLGGGAVIDPDSRNKMKSHGHLVYLKMDIEVLKSRLMKNAIDLSSRPLLGSKSESDLHSKLKLLYDSRRPFYEEAEMVIDTHGSTTVNIVQSIMEKLFSEFRIAAS